MKAITGSKLYISEAAQVLIDLVSRSIIFDCLI